MVFSFPNINCFQIQYKEWYSNKQLVEIITNIKSFCYVCQRLCRFILSSGLGIVKSGHFREETEIDGMINSFIQSLFTSICFYIWRQVLMKAGLSSNVTCSRRQPSTSDPRVSTFLVLGFIQASNLASSILTYLMSVCVSSQ